MEKSIDEAAVWRRVSAASREASPEQTDPAGLLSPGILAAIGEARARGASYQALSRRYPGKNVFSQLFSQERQQAAALAGLYFLLTGTKPQSASGKTAPAKSQTYAAQLRQLMIGEERSAGRLQALAEKASGQCRETLLRLSREEMQHWNRLLEALGETL